MLFSSIVCRLLLSGCVLSVLRVDGRTESLPRSTAPEIVFQKLPLANAKWIFSSDERLLIARSGDRILGRPQVGMWDTQTGLLVREFPPFSDSDVSFALSQNNKWIAGVTAHQMTVLDLQMGQVIMKEKVNSPSAALAFSPDSKWLAVAAGKEVLLWKTAGWERSSDSLLPGPLEKHETLQTASFSSDGKLFTSTTSNNRALIWNYESQKLERDIYVSSHLSSVAIARPQDMLLSTSAGLGPGPPDLLYEAWDSITGRKVRIRAVDEATHGAESAQAVLSPNGRWLLTIAITGKICTIKAFDSSDWHSTKPVTTDFNGTFLPNLMAISDYGHKAFYAIDHEQVVLNLQTGVRSILRAQAVYVPGDAVVSRDGQLMAIRGDNTPDLSRITLLDTSKDQPIASRLPGSRLAAIGMDKNAYVIAVPEGGRIFSSLTDLARKKTRELRVETGVTSHGNNMLADMDSVRLSPDAQWMTQTHEKDQTDPETHEKNQTDPAYTISVRRRVLNGWKNVVEIPSSTEVDVAFSWDATRLVIADRLSSVKIFDLNQPARPIFVTKVQSQSPRVYGSVLSISRNNARIATSLVTADEDRGSDIHKLQVWDRVSGETHLISIPECTGFISAVQFTPEGNSLVVGCSIGSLFLIDFRNGVVQSTLVGHTDRIVSIGFLATAGLTLVTTSRDGSTKLWNRFDGSLLATLFILGEPDADILEEESPRDWLLVTPQGFFDGSAAAMKAIAWRAGPTEVIPVDSLYNDYAYPGLLSQVLLGKVPTPCADIASSIRLAGLRTMMAQPTSLAHEETHEQKNWLCFAQPITALTGNIEDDVQEPHEINGVRIVPRSATCPYSIEIPGERVESRKCETSDLKFTSDDLQTATVSTTLHILAVAVDSYPPQSGERPLTSSVTAAKEITESLERAFTKEEKSERRVAIKRIFDLDASRTNILTGLSAFSDSIGANDTAILLFSGHGIVPEGQEMFYFEPVDFLADNSQSEEDTGISTAMLVDALRNIPARRVVLIIDACQSGAALDSLSRVADAKLRLEMVRPRNIRTGSVPSGISIIAATTPVQLAIQSPSGITSLAQSIVGTLKGFTSGRRIWITDLIDGVRQSLPEISGRMGVGFTPLFVSKGANFPIGGK